MMGTTALCCESKVNDGPAAAGSHDILGLMTFYIRSDMLDRSKFLSNPEFFFTQWPNSFPGRLTNKIWRPRSSHDVASILRTYGYQGSP